MAMTIHTFELTTVLSPKETQATRDYIFEYAFGKKSMSYEKDNRLYFNRWCNYGVRFYLQPNPVTPECTLHLLVTPAKIMGSDDALSLFSVTKQDVPLIDEKIQAILDKLPIKRYSCRMELKRLDFCQNVIVPNQKYINEYLRLLRKGASVSGWIIDSYPKGDERNDHSFRRLKNDKYCQVTVYDKLYQIKQKGYQTCWVAPERILRVEVSLFRQGIIDELKYWNICTGLQWTEHLLRLSVKGETIMDRALKKLVPDLSYYSISSAKDYLWSADARISPTKQKNLLAFLCQLSRYEHLSKKEIEENIPNGAKRWKELEELDVNPVTIKARAGISYLPSLPQLVKLGWLPNLEDTPV